MCAYIYVKMFQKIFVFCHIDILLLILPNFFSQVGIHEPLSRLYFESVIVTILFLSLRQYRPNKDSTQISNKGLGPKGEWARQRLEPAVH